MSSSDSSSSERFTGRVKWFNTKAGYGFITVTDGPKSGSDVFVHHSSIKVDSEQYKYLVQGEYIEFSLSDTKTSAHEFQAGDVSGIKGGKLMCETRNETKTARTHHRVAKTESVSDANSEPTMPRSVRPINPQEKQGEWNYVSKPTTGGTRGRGEGRTGGRGGGRTGGRGGGRTGGRGEGGRGEGGRG